LSNFDVPYFIVGIRPDDSSRSWTWKFLPIRGRGR